MTEMNDCLLFYFRWFLLENIVDWWNGYIVSMLVMSSDIVRSVLYSLSNLICCSVLSVLSVLSVSLIIYYCL